MTQLKLIPNLSSFLISIAKARKEFPPPLRPIPFQASTFQNTGEIATSDAQRKVAEVQSSKNLDLERPNPKVAAGLEKINQKRAAQGKAPLDWAASMKRIQALKGSAADKKKRFEQIRQQMGLSKGEMKKLFTQPLTEAHQKAAQNLDSLKKQKEAQFSTDLNIAEKSFGKTSPQVAAMKASHQAVLRSYDSEAKKMRNEAGFYKNMYPGFWSKLGGFFKKVGGGILKAVSSVGAVLKKIPGIGSLVRIAENVLSPLKQLFTGKIGGFFKSLGTGVLKSIGDAKGLLPLIPGVGSVASMIASGIGGLVSKLRTS